MLKENQVLFEKIAELELEKQQMDILKSDETVELTDLIFAKQKQIDLLLKNEESHLKEVEGIKQQLDNYIEKFTLKNEENKNHVKYMLEN